MIVASIGSFSLNRSAVYMNQWDQLLRTQYDAWGAVPGHDYLGIGDDFDHACPPLLIMGGADVAHNANPLVVVSLEPLTNEDHYEKQCAYAGSSVENYRSWNLDYFKVFPSSELAGKGPQTYWRTMHDVVAGHCGSTTDFSWQTFGDHYLELPSIPVHAGEHPSVSMDQFRPALIERLELVYEKWPKATFLALGTATLNALGLRRSDGVQAFDMPIKDSERLASLGNVWSAPVSRYSLDLKQTSVPIFWRYAFARTFRGRPQGRRWTGEQLQKARAAML